MLADIGLIFKMVPIFNYYRFLQINADVYRLLFGTWLPKFRTNPYY